MELGVLTSKDNLSVEVLKIRPPQKRAKKFLASKHNLYFKCLIDGKYQVYEYNGLNFKPRGIFRCKGS